MPIRTFRYIAALVLLAASASPDLRAQDLPSAMELLQNSLAYHDPDGAWYTLHHRFEIEEARGDGVMRQTEVQFNFPDEAFSYRSERDGHLVESRLEAETCAARVDGNDEVSDELREQFRLTCDGIKDVRDYYGYTLGLPMKLQDTGTLLDPRVEAGTFMDRDVLVIRVTYDASVGGDVWYFYFDPGTYALVGSRFYHDESKNDGEYLAYEGEIEANGVRLPRVRAWYFNSDDSHLGTDTLTAYEHVAAGDGATGS